MFNLFRNWFNAFRQQPPVPSVVTFTFNDVTGKRISVQLDPSLPVQAVVARLNAAGGGPLWRVSAEGRAEFIANNNCPLRNK